MIDQDEKTDVLHAWAALAKRLTDTDAGIVLRLLAYSTSEAVWKGRAQGALAIVALWLLSHLYV